MLDADGARQEEQFGADLLADECASRRLGDLILFGRRKSNDYKTTRGEYTTTSEFGRMTLPADGLAHANWTLSHRRRRSQLFAEGGKTQDVNHGQMTGR